MEMESEVSLFFSLFYSPLYVVPVRIIVFTRSQMPLLINKMTVLVHIREINGKMTELNNSPQFLYSQIPQPKFKSKLQNSAPANRLTAPPAPPVVQSFLL